MGAEETGPNWSRKVSCSTCTQDGELPATGRLQIGFETGDLDAAVQRLSGAGLHPPAIVDEAFGRILHLTDPDGNVLYIVQNEPELYS